MLEVRFGTKVEDVAKVVAANGNKSLSRVTRDFVESLAAKVASEAQNLQHQMELAIPNEGVLAGTVLSMDHSLVAFISARNELRQMLGHPTAMKQESISPEIADLAARAAAPADGIQVSA